MPIEPHIFNVKTGQVIANVDYNETDGLIQSISFDVPAGQFQIYARVAGKEYRFTETSSSPISRSLNLTGRQAHIDEKLSFAVRDQIEHGKMLVRRGLS